jgi:hypothetical protein
MSHCSLAVSRGPRHKYVQFAAASDLLPPLLFDLDEDPGQTHNLLAGVDGRAGSGVLEAAWSASQELLRWHMRTAERMLSGSFLHPTKGLVEARDTWG